MTRAFDALFSVLVALTLLFATPALARDGHPRWSGSGLVIKGFDASGYHTSGTAQPGSADHSVVWRGGTFRFASKAAADRFRANPSASPRASAATAPAASRKTMSSMPTRGCSASTRATSTSSPPPPAPSASTRTRKVSSRPREPMRRRWALWNRGRTDAPSARQRTWIPAQGRDDGSGWGSGRETHEAGEVAQPQFYPHRRPWPSGSDGDPALRAAPSEAQRDCAAIARYAP